MRCFVCFQETSHLPSSLGKRKQNKGFFFKGKSTSVPGCHTSTVCGHSMSRVLKCPELTRRRQESHIRGAFTSHRQLIVRDAEVMEEKRASEGWGPLLWVVLWQCLSWLLCGVRTKQSASILPQKLVTLRGPSIRPRSYTRLPTRTQRLERDRKRETLVCAHYQASLPIHSSSNCECQLLFIGTAAWTFTATRDFQVKDWFMLTICWIIFSVTL